MGKVRWTGWTVALATLLVAAGVQSARADVASDLPAAQLVYPRIVVNTAQQVNTMVRLTKHKPISGQFALLPRECERPLQQRQHLRRHQRLTCSSGSCTQGWMETDFRINLTSYQPLEWSSEGRPVIRANSLRRVPEQPLLHLR